MKVLQFKTQNEFDEWLNDNELFQCYDKNMNLLGEILGTDADVLVSFKLAELNMAYGFCQIKRELTEKQLEELCSKRLIKTVVTEGLFFMSLEQRVIIKRLRKDFEDASKAGLYAFSNDENNRLWFVNGKAFTQIATEDNIETEWKNIDGECKYVKLTSDEMSRWVEIDEHLVCDFIDGNKQIDFCNWSANAFPMYAQLDV